MKTQELLKDKGLELTKGKVLDSDVFKFGGSDVHVIYIADTQTLIDKFKMDVIRPGVQFDVVVTPATKESFKGDLANPQSQNEAGQFSFKIRRVMFNMSMQDVADQTGISKATVSRLEQGKDVLAKTERIINELYTKLSLKLTMPFAPTTKKSHEGDPVAKFELDDFARSANKGVCSVKGCDKPSTQFGLCEEHFRKIY